MIRLGKILKTSLPDILKMSWKDVLKTSCKRLEYVLAKHLEDILKISGKGLEDVIKTYNQNEHIGLDQDVMKTPSEDVSLGRI